MKYKLPCNHEIFYIEIYQLCFNQEREERQYDHDRTLIVKEYGIEVIRFKNEEVLNNLAAILDKIKNCLIP
jgi:very-short-patch-repair endonuclease